VIDEGKFNLPLFGVNVMKYVNNYQINGIAVTTIQDRAILF